MSRDEDLKKYWCLYPFDGFTVDPTGKAQPCPSWTDHKGHILEDMRTSKKTASEIFNTGRLAEIRKQMANGQRVASCSSCWHNEEEGLKSRRIRKIQGKLKVNSLPDNFAQSYKPKLKHIELNFSNSCNLACVMCNRTHSSGWYQQEKSMPLELKDKLKMMYNLIHTPLDTFKSFVLSQDFVDSIIDNIKEYESVMIKGGEPLFDKRCVNFLDRISKINPYVKVIIVTNVTMLTPKMLEILKRFNDIQINLSIDGIGETYEWVRGYSWEKINMNFISLMDQASKHMEVDINVTLSIFNIHVVPDMLDYFSKFKTIPGKYLMSFHLVYEPWMTLNLGGEQVLKDFLTNTEPKMKTYVNADTMTTTQSDIDNIITYMKTGGFKTNLAPEKHKQLAREYINWMNKVRGKNIQDISPYVKRLLIN